MIYDISTKENALASLKDLMRTDSDATALTGAFTPPNWALDFSQNMRELIRFRVMQNPVDTDDSDAPADTSDFLLYEASGPDNGFNPNEIKMFDITQVIAINSYVFDDDFTSLNDWAKELIRIARKVYRGEETEDIHLIVRNTGQK